MNGICEVHVFLEPGSKLVYRFHPYGSGQKLHVIINYYDSSSYWLDTSGEAASRILKMIITITVFSSHHLVFRDRLLLNTDVPFSYHSQ